MKSVCWEGAGAIDTVVGAVFQSYACDDTVSPNDIMMISEAVKSVGKLSRFNFSQVPFAIPSFGRFAVELFPLILTVI